MKKEVFFVLGIFLVLIMIFSVSGFGFFYDGIVDIFIEGPYCGDGNCDSGENCSSCSDDCGICAYCGDGNCDGGETCSSCPEDCGSCGTSGGGGGGVMSVIYRIKFIFYPFKLDKDFVKIYLKQGESVEEFIEVTNIGTAQLRTSLKPLLIEEFLTIEEESFLLKPGEKKVIKMIASAKEDTRVDSYLGRLYIGGGSISETVYVEIIVSQKESFLDLETTLDKVAILPGEEIKADMDIINKGDFDGLDLDLYYSIKNFEGKIFLFQEEGLTIEKELDITRELKIPIDIPVGNYIFYTRVSSGNLSDVSTVNFRVTEIEKPGFSIIMAFLSRVGTFWFIVIIAVSVVIIYMLYRRIVKGKKHALADYLFSKRKSFG